MLSLILQIPNELSTIALLLVINAVLAVAIAILLISDYLSLLFEFLFGFIS